jgi:short-subunit dehydrogenase
MSAPRGPVAVVTGASAGVGRATALEFAANGYDVALVARGCAGLEAAAAEVEGSGRRALVCPADVASFDEVDAAAARAEAELGRIDIWVNNAMTTVFERFVDITPADFERAVAVTFLGQVWGTKAALARMRPRDWGTIVNVGSALAFLGIPLQAPYCASKFACRGFFESIRSELLEEGSNVQMRMVHLPALNTPQFEWCQTNLARHPQPVPPIYQPEIAAEAIVRAAMQKRPQRVVGSWNKLVAAAGVIAPDFAVHYAAKTGIGSQLTDDPLPRNRPSNLREPADSTRDYGAHGMFDDRATGVRDAQFRRSLPYTFWQIGQAAVATIKSRWPTRSR